jgi:hypothetical protein
MARAAQSEEGTAGFLQHRDETQGQIERLEQVFELLGRAARGKTCEAIQGIIAEGEEIMEEYKGSVALDAGLISSAQAVEHYEIARYGTLIEEDVIGFVSAIAFRPMEDGEMVMPLSEENGDILDLRTNPVCAGRFAIALLDLISQNGWFDVDLRVSDGGSEIARIKPTAKTAFNCDAGR